MNSLFDFKIVNKDALGFKMVANGHIFGISCSDPFLMNN